MTVLLSFTESINFKLIISGFFLYKSVAIIYSWCTSRGTATLQWWNATNSNYPVAQSGTACTQALNRQHHWPQPGIYHRASDQSGTSTWSPAQVCTDEAVKWCGSTPSYHTNVSTTDNKELGCLWTIAGNRYVGFLQNFHGTKFVVSYFMKQLFDKMNLISGTSTGMIQVYNISSGLLVKELSIHMSTVRWDMLVYMYFR